VIWMIEVARKAQDRIIEEHPLPSSFTLQTAAEWVGDYPDLIGSVFDVPLERLPEVQELLGVTVDPEAHDYFLVARSDPTDPPAPQ
jgi:hypothetical protein